MIPMSVVVPFMLSSAISLLMAPRICHKRWRSRGYRISDNSDDRISGVYIGFLRMLYGILFLAVLAEGFVAISPRGGDQD